MNGLSARSIAGGLATLRRALSAPTRLKLAAGAALALSCTPIAAQSPIDRAPPAELQPVTAERIAAALQLDRLAGLLASEIAAAPSPLAQSAEPDPGWQAIVAGIAAPARVQALLDEGVAAALAGQGEADRAAVAAALGYWETAEGRRVLDLELSARAALADPAAERAALDAFAAAAARGSPRIAAVRDLIDGADLVEPAVAVSLNIALASLRGLQAGGMTGDATAADLAADVWLQEPELRAEQAGWIEALLYLATGPLDEAEMARLVAASTSPGARRLNAILDSGITAGFSRIAEELGRAAAMRATGAPL